LNPDHKFHKSMLPKKVYESDTASEYSSSGGAFLLKADSDDTSGLESGADDIDFKTKVCSCLSFCCNSKKTQGIGTVHQPHGLFGQQSYKEVCAEIATKSNYGGLADKSQYGIISAIIKSGDDLKQEQFASQMISKFKEIFDAHGLKIWLKPFNIIATCSDGGLI